jgi:hypothetical protein
MPAMTAIMAMTVLIKKDPMMISHMDNGVSTWVACTFENTAITIYPQVIRTISTLSSGTLRTRARSRPLLLALFLEAISKPKNSSGFLLKHNI